MIRQGPGEVRSETELEEPVQGAQSLRAPPPSLSCVRPVQPAIAAVIPAPSSLRNLSIFSFTKLGLKTSCMKQFGRWHMVWKYSELVPAGEGRRVTLQFSQQPSAHLDPRREIQSKTVRGAGSSGKRIPDISPILYRTTPVPVYSIPKIPSLFTLELSP